VRHAVEPACDEHASLLGRTSLIETESYGTRGDKDTFLDRVARRGAVGGAVHADLLLLVVDSRRDDFRSDGRFAQDWLDWYARQPGLQRPPALVVMTGIDRLVAQGEQPHPHTQPDEPSRAVPADPTLLSRRVAELQNALPHGFTAKIVSVRLDRPEAPELDEVLAPALASLVSQCARGALIRHLHEHATRSKAGRFLKQVGKQGQKAWSLAGAEIRKRWESRKAGKRAAEPHHSREPTST
jgi:hypothetical protein